MREREQERVRASTPELQRVMPNAETSLLEAKYRATQDWPRERDANVAFHTERLQHRLAGKSADEVRAQWMDWRRKAAQPEDTTKGLVDNIHRRYVEEMNAAYVRVIDNTTRNVPRERGVEPMDISDHLASARRALANPQTEELMRRDIVRVRDAAVHEPMQVLEARFKQHASDAQLIADKDPPLAERIHLRACAIAYVLDERQQQRLPLVVEHDSEPHRHLPSPRARPLPTLDVTEPRSLDHTEPNLAHDVHRIELRSDITRPVSNSQIVAQHPLPVELGVQDVVESQRAERTPGCDRVKFIPAFRDASGNDAVFQSVVEDVTAPGRKRGREPDVTRPMAEEAYAAIRREALRDAEQAELLQRAKERDRLLEMSVSPARRYYDVCAVDPVAKQALTLELGRLQAQHPTVDSAQAAFVAARDAHSRGEAQSESRYLVMGVVLFDALAEQRRQELTRVRAIAETGESKGELRDALRELMMGDTAVRSPHLHRAIVADQCNDHRQALLHALAVQAPSLREAAQGFCDLHGVSGDERCLQHARLVMDQHLTDVVRAEAATLQADCAIDPSNRTAQMQLQIVARTLQLIELEQNRDWRRRFEDDGAAEAVTR